MEWCNICRQHKRVVVDELCEDCEPMWLDNLEKISKELPKSTPLGELFKKTTAMTQAEMAERFTAPPGPFPPS